MSGLAIAFLLMDASMKLLAVPVVLQAQAELGFQGEGMARGLGGAVAVKLRIGDPLFTHVLFGVYVGILVWGGIYLRDARLRQILPLRSDMRDRAVPAA